MKNEDFLVNYTVAKQELSNERKDVENGTTQSCHSRSF